MKQLHIVITFMLVSYIPVFSQEQGTSKTEHTARSINLKTGYKIGNEIGLPLIQIEYEDERWGRIIAHGDVGAFVSVLGFGMLYQDIGIGYAYPLKKYSGKKIQRSLNGHLTYISYGLFGVMAASPSLLIEYEFRRKWKWTSCSVAPFFRAPVFCPSCTSIGVSFTWSVNINLN